MSKLIMVRHGQASFGAGNYDKLSDKGIAQSVALGEHWARRGRQLDAVFSGGLERQVHTLRAVRDVYQRQGRAFPEARVLEAFNEYDSDGIMRHFLPALLEREPEVREGMERINREGVASPAGKKAFQKVFQIVMDRWFRGEGETEGVESWQGFRDRVLGGIRTVLDAFPSGRTVAVFTSGGPVSAVMQHALKIPDREALDLGWIIKNGSLTEFRYSGDRFTLTGFNLVPHYEHEDMITYR